MIYGIGVDLVEIKRFENLISDSKKLDRFFHPKEIIQNCNKSVMMEHYASRFAVKEAFSKAIGTGLSMFSLKDVYVVNDNNGKPEIVLENKAEKLFNERCGNARIFVSITHEKEYAQAFVVIENN